MKGFGGTVIAGVVFLIPVGFVIWILLTAFGVVVDLVDSVSQFLPFEGALEILLVNLGAVALSLALGYGAGRVAQSAASGKRIEYLDRFLAEALPPYRIAKRTVTDAVNRRSLEDGWIPVIVGGSGDLRWLGYEIERLPGGEVVVFRPSAPNPTTGTIWTVPPEKLEPVALSPRALSEHMIDFGEGLGARLGASP